MTSFTPRGYPVPDDYQQPADVPAALDALADAIDADVAAVESKQVVAGNGLTGGGTGAADRTLNVGAGTGITVAADSVALNKAYTDGLYQPKNALLATIAAEGQTQVGDKSIGVKVLDFGTVPANSESGVLSFNINDGSYVFASVQHHSTYLVCSANIATTGPTQRVDVKVRNSTLSTDHTNVKVHVLIVNP